MFLMIGSRPDLAVAISFLSQSMSNPSPHHMQAAKRVLRYIKGTRDLKLHLGNRENDGIMLTRFSNANWGNDAETRRSTTGYLFYLCDGLISWTSKKQPTVALLTTEAEYIALSHASTEAIWLRSFLNELGFDQIKATVINEDNQSCISLAKNPINHARTKHI